MTRPARRGVGCGPTRRIHPRDCPPLGGRHVEALRQVGDRDDDAPSEADALDFTRADEFVGGGAGDAEDDGGLLDGECEPAPMLGGLPIERLT